MKKVSRGGRATSAFLLAASMALLISCGRGQGPASQRQLIVFNAGSLTSPVADLLNEFARLHPGITPLQESSGSLEAARKITELGKPCDVLAVADYEVVPSMVMPQHADWYLIFARNQLTLIYTPKSKFSDQINSDNWYEILQRAGVQYGYSNTDLEPAGYPALDNWKFDEKDDDTHGPSDSIDSEVLQQTIPTKAS